MKSYPGLEDLHIRDCALKGSELFGSTKRKFDLPPGVHCDSHRPDKVDYFISRPYTKVRRACIEESLVSTEHGVAHTTSVLKTKLLFFSLAYCTIANQLYQKMLGNASQYIDFVQYQSWSSKIWHTISHVQRIEEGISLHQQCEIRFLVLP
jgi:phage tail protein X